MIITLDVYITIAFALDQVCALDASVSRCSMFFARLKLFISEVPARLLFEVLDPHQTSCQIGMTSLGGWPGQRVTVNVQIIWSVL